MANQYLYNDLKIETNIVSMIKDIKSDGYNAIQLSSIEQKENKAKKPHLGHFSKNKIAPQKNIKEFRVEDTSGVEIGQTLDATHFEEGTFVNVRSRSKGKGFAGTIKRHNFKGKDATHGNSISHRHTVQLVNVKSQEEYLKVKRWLVIWEMKW